ncbi:WD40-repeat-containing domain protein [Chytridium lagenaria]|nr:WD40-repeat-containing domain protein [Chytridium lagenaria]
MVLPFSYFSSEGKLSRVRWSPQSIHNSTSLSFVAGTYDELDHALVLWNCDPSVKAALASPDTRWQAEPVNTLKHDGAVLDLAFVHGQRGPLGLPFMVTASSNGHVGVFTCSDTSKGEGEIKALGSQLFHSNPAGKGVPCYALAVQPNASSDPEIASVGSDGHIAFSTLQGQTVAKIENADSSQITGVKWTTANEIVISTESGRLKAGFTIVDSSEDVSAYNCIAVHPTQATRLATGSQDGTVKVWDLRSTSEPEVEAYKIHSGDVWEVTFHPTNAQKIISCSEDGKTSELQWSYDINSLQPVTGGHRQFKVDQNIHNRLPLNSLDCHRDNNLVVAVGDASGIFLSHRL